LPLLVLGVPLADDAGDAATTDDLTMLADDSNAGTDFQTDSLPGTTIFRVESGNIDAA
jgi:hypothetical protein